MGKYQELDTSELSTEEKGYRLRSAAEENDVTTAKLLLQADPESVHFGEDVALRTAAEQGHLDMIRLLRSAGASVHIYNGAPLRLARAGGHSAAEQFISDWMSEEPRPSPRFAALPISKPTA
jgi:hypothetical protein